MFVLFVFFFLSVFYLLFVCLYFCICCACCGNLPYWKAFVDDLVQSCVKAAGTGVMGSRPGLWGQMGLQLGQLMQGMGKNSNLEAHRPTLFRLAEYSKHRFFPQHYFPAVEEWLDGRTVQKKFSMKPPNANYLCRGDE